MTDVRRGERDRRRGHHMLSHLRTEAYPAYGRSIYPPHEANGGPPTVEGNDEAIPRGKDGMMR